MKVTKPIQASPEFIEANKNNPKYALELKDTVSKEKWDFMMENFGECRVMETLDGELCFFSEVL